MADNLQNERYVCNIRVDSFEKLNWYNRHNDKNWRTRLKDTVTIFKFSCISELFSNRRFRRDKAQDVNFLSLANNYWVWIELFNWSSVQKPGKITKNPGSEKRMKIFDFWLNSCVVIFSRNSCVVFRHFCA